MCKKFAKKIVKIRNGGVGGVMVNSELKAPSPTHNLARTHTGDLQSRGRGAGRVGRQVGRWGPGYTGIYTTEGPHTQYYMPTHTKAVCVCVLAQLLIFLQCWGVGRGRVKPFITSSSISGSGFGTYIRQLLNTHYAHVKETSFYALNKYQLFYYTALVSQQMP